MKNITIERMTNKTVRAVSEIETACFTSPWSYDAFLSELSNPMSVTFVALEIETVVGFINLSFVLDEGSVNNVAVLPSCRGSGIGERLVRQAIAFCADHDIKVLTLEVRKSNAPAISLYEKLDFRQVGMRKNFYTLPTEDALLMTRKI